MAELASYGLCSSWKGGHRDPDWSELPRLSAPSSDGFDRATVAYVSTARLIDERPACFRQPKTAPEPVEQFKGELVLPYA